MIFVCILASLMYYAISDIKKPDNGNLDFNGKQTNNSEEISTDNTEKAKKTNRKAKIGKSLLVIGLVLFASNISVRLYSYFSFETPISGSAEWIDSNGQNYLNIKADDYYSLGFHTGYHLWRQILNAKVAMGMYINNDDMALIREYENHIPSEYIQEMKGIAKGVSVRTGIYVSYEDLLKQNVFLDIYYGKINAMRNLNQNPIGCTSIAVKNSNGTIVAGQNFDFTTILGKGKMLESISFVYHEIKGKNGVFSLRLGGILALPTAKNSKGVLSLTNVLSTNISTGSGLPEMIKFRMALENANNIDEFKGIIFSENPKFVLNLLFINSTSMIGIQNNITSLRLNQSDMIVHANRFEYADWNEAYMHNSSYSETRLMNAKYLAFNLFNDDLYFSQSDLFSLLTNRNGSFGENSAIIQNTKDVSTMAFITTEYFGLGTAEGARGRLPI